MDRDDEMDASCKYTAESLKQYESEEYRQSVTAKDVHATACLLVREASTVRGMLDELINWYGGVAVLAEITACKTDALKAKEEARGEAMAQQASTRGGKRILVHWGSMDMFKGYMVQSTMMLLREDSLLPEDLDFICKLPAMARDGTITWEIEDKFEVVKAKALEAEWVVKDEMEPCMTLVENLSRYIHIQEPA